MDVSSIRGRVPSEIVDSLQQRGISSFTPPQELAIKAGLLDSENIVVSSPTASGKTVIAEIACANAIISKGRKAVYVAPMRALATEKFNEFREAYPYIKSTISIGDLDSSDPWLSSYDMLFFSTEKFDSLMRHGISWIQGIGCVVFDEVHMLGDQSRGPTLELLITKLASMCDAQVIALSATIGNPDEIARWMKASLVRSDYRPVKLLKGVVHDGKVLCAGEKRGKRSELPLLGSNKIPEVKVVEDTLSRHKQALLFYATKRNAETGAKRLSVVVKNLLSDDEKVRLKAIAENALSVLPRPTEQCKLLASCIENGVAFHHAGLLNKQRAIVEDSFRSNVIKAICATTTLGFGVNLPAHTVVVRDTSRFNSRYSERMGVNEVVQLFGRAGRPKYDTEGRALLLAANRELVDELFKRYIYSELDPVESSLGVAPVLRTHVLAFIAQGFLQDKGAMQRFMEKTFYSFQFGNQHYISMLIDKIVDELVEWGFVEPANGDAYLPTRLGQRVSELYIDPLSARWIVDTLEAEPDTLGTLYMISNTMEMRPYVRATADAEDQYISYLSANPGMKSVWFGSGTDYGHQDPVRAFSTSLMLRDWMEELKEPEIVKKYSTTPGALYLKVTNADWLIYSAIEIARVLKKRTHDLIEARVRLRYGIKEELLDLVRLEQVGRARARALYNNGLCTVNELRANREKAVKVLGKDIAERIFRQLE